MKLDQIHTAVKALIDIAPKGDLNAVLGRKEIKIDNLLKALLSAGKAGEDMEAIFLELRKVYTADEFWDSVELLSKNELRPYTDLSFLREMNTDDQKSFLNVIFENMIRYQEPWDYVAEQLQTGIERVEIAYRMYNTLIDWVVQQRCSERWFGIKCNEYFGINESVYKYLWVLFEDNREMLIERSTIISFKRVSMALQKLREAQLKAKRTRGRNSAG